MSEITGLTEKTIRQGRKEIETGMSRYPVVNHMIRLAVDVIHDGWKVNRAIPKHCYRWRQQQLPLEKACAGTSLR